MKKVIVFLTVISSVISAKAQSNKEDIDMIQAAFGKDKKEIVNEYMHLGGDTAAKFWAVYDKYETERKQLGKERISIIEDYAKQYDALTDPAADKLINRVFANDLAYTKLNQKYFKDFAAAGGARNAAKYFQLETFIQNAVRLKIQTEIPFIDELDNSIKKGN